MVADIKKIMEWIEHTVEMERGRICKESKKEGK